MKREDMHKLRDLAIASHKGKTHNNNLFTVQITNMILRDELNEKKINKTISGFQKKLFEIWSPKND